MNFLVDQCTNQASKLLLRKRSNLHWKKQKPWRFKAATGILHERNLHKIILFVYMLQAALIACGGHALYSHSVVAFVSLKGRRSSKPSSGGRVKRRERRYLTYKLQALPVCLYRSRCASTILAKQLGKLRFALVRLISRHRLRPRCKQAEKAVPLCFRIGGAPILNSGRKRTSATVRRSRKYLKFTTVAGQDPSLRIKLKMDRSKVVEEK